MTDEDKGILSPPDLSELMSQIIIDGEMGERLVFVEYDPATRAFYDHVGLPKNEAKKLREGLKLAAGAAGSCEQFLRKLCVDSGLHASVPTISDGKRGERNTCDVFIERLAEMSTSLLSHRFDLLLDTIDPRTFEKQHKQAKALVCIARSRTANNAAELEWLKNPDTDLYEVFHWLIQRIPQPKSEGGAGERRVHGWETVDNSTIGGFIELAGLEYIFGMRKATEMLHARFNIFFETGEYVGQMIAFTDAPAEAGAIDSGEDGAKKALHENAVKAAELVRRVLPDIREARYMDAILSGGERGDLDHVLVQHLPTLVPVQKLYVRTIDRNSDHTVVGGWNAFFADRSKVSCHSPVKNSTPRDSFDHFAQEQWTDEDPENFITAAINKAPSTEWMNGFVDWDQPEGVVLAFSTLGPELTEGGLAVIAVIDPDFLPMRLYHSNPEDPFEKAFRNPNNCSLTEDGQYYLLSYKKEDNANSSEIDLPLDLMTRPPCFSDNALWNRFLRTQLKTTLSVILEPRKPLRDRLNQAGAKDCKTYREQFGTSIYGEGYLNVDNIGVEKPEERWSEEFRTIVRVVKDTYTKLSDTLYEPRGYRAIAATIFYRFFCPLWRYFGLKGDPVVKKHEGTASRDTEENTSLGSLIREALDFEDTLRLDGGYREHFVHSYHVFLLGLYLVETLGLEKRFDLARFEIWFLISMYHDIAYPIQKMEDITKNYLDRLNPGTKGQVGDDLAIEVKIGFGKLLASGLFGARLRAITNALVDRLFPDITDTLDEGRETQIKELKEYLETHHGNMNLTMYKEGMKDTLYQYCLRLALTHGEHGVLSALLFDSAARDSRLPVRVIRNEIAVAILGHHILDKEGKWALTDRWTFGRSERKDGTSVKTSNKREQYDEALEAAGSIAWDPSFLLYDLRNGNKNSSFWAALLILCDSVAQWGRTDDETDGKLALLRSRHKDEDALVVLCYPRTMWKKEALKFRDHYENQLMHITGLSSRDEDSSSTGFVKLLYRCPIFRDPKVPISAQRCGECRGMSPTVKEKIGVIPLTCKPKSFPDVLQGHIEIDEDARKKTEAR